MRALLPYLRPYRRPMSLAFVLMLIEAAVELWQPLLLAKLIQEGIGGRDVRAVYVWGGWLIASALGGFVCGIVNTFWASHVSQSLAHDLRSDLLRGVQSAGLSDLRGFKPAALLGRMTGDVTQVQAAVYFCLRLFFRSPLLIAGSVVLAMLVDWRLGLPLAVTVPILLAVVYVAIRKGFHAFGEAQENMDRTSGILRENLVGMRLIRAMVRRAGEYERFGAANAAWRDRTTSALRLSEMTIPGALLAMNLIVLAILTAGSGLLADGGAEAGELVAVVNYALRVIGALSFVTMIITSLSRAAASWRRIAEVLRLPEERDRAAAAPAGHRGGRGVGESDADADAIRRPTGDIVFDCVGFRYPDAPDVAVLRDLSFRVRRGGTAVVMGMTGAGKTSLLQLLPRLYESAVGRIEIGGVDIRALPKETLRAAIGYVPQQSVLFEGTVRDNLRMGALEATDAELEEAALAAQIHGEIAALPGGYDMRLSAGGSLSGGQRQRLAVARALVRRPELLLLDDCTSALDAATEGRLLRSLRETGRTVLMSTQKVAAARHADLILLLADGALAAQGKHDELLASSPLYREIVRSQSKEAQEIHA
ncbi:ABC transporter ATP-binding protein [Cohnella sp. GCM10020058]|uniref:ABC transporter ATP-binding protein n=1 Tax=Cohnella sp. GCM10020058 TaxID=3317330 RepID=UPI003636A7F7